MPLFWYTVCFFISIPQNDQGKYECKYLDVELVGYPPGRIVLENNYSLQFPPEWEKSYYLMNSCLPSLYAFVWYLHTWSDSKILAYGRSIYVYVYFVSDVMCFTVTVKWFCQALVDLAGTGEIGRHLPSHALCMTFFDSPFSLCGYNCWSMSTKTDIVFPSYAEFRHSVIHVLQRKRIKKRWFCTRR